MDRLEDPSGGSALQVSLADDLNILIGPSGVYSLLGSVDIFIWSFSRESTSDSYLGLSLVDIVDKNIPGVLILLCNMLVL